MNTPSAAVSPEPTPTIAPAAASTPSAEPPASAEKTLPASLPIITHRRDRAATIPLEYPLDIDGKPLDANVVRRLNAQAVADFLEAIGNSPDTKILRFPMFYDVDGNKLPDAVIDALDDDDAVALTKATAGFLPRRFRAEGPEPDTTPVTGDPTAR